MTLDAKVVAARLGELRALCDRSTRPFHLRVAARLAELRALCELADHLHRR